MAASEEILHIAPDFCWRITGRTWRMVIAIDLRFTSMIRSHASSSMAWGGASPRPVPTLLTRMSIRFIRAAASRAMAAQSALRVTSAGKANASPALVPPSSMIMRTVSSALSSRRSTHITCAPSRANRIAMARPLPIVSPILSGAWVWPAPTMMAVLPASRPFIKAP